ncbi:hypothetical protein N7532_004347 [Penicillium argentinense]|uniref:Uncharacterized protein n=1 Tax=Penicillium argentinense TaxID=1131581 RepID=A0A9W9FPB1_9EURO|nr:uncharacterized protein N7532_004347 [Penicillium argentinense]KAJ5103818.1 hypothetical protein N7532_004347 [Penicillium argentinense]
MPHKVNNDSNSTLASRGSSGDQVIITEVRGMSIDHFPPIRPGGKGYPPCPISRLSPANADAAPAANPVRRPPVVVHNKGGQIYDETRPSDWDKQRWK